METKRAALLALVLLAACDGNPIDPGNGTDPDPDPDPTGPAEGDTNVVQDLRGFRYDGTTLEIDMAGVSSSGAFGTFVRRPAMDLPAHGGGAPAYLAYEFQETNMTRSYLAYVAENERDTLIAVASADGGQFNEHNGGGGWIRVTGYSRPSISGSPSPTPGPEQGTFSYYGSYAGVFVPGPGDPDGPPRPDPLIPQEPLGVRGVIQVNAQFERSGDGEVVEGGITNRTLHDRDGSQITSFSIVDSDGTVTDIDTTTLPDLVLRETEISDNGTFLGDVEFLGSPGSSAGKFDGAFGGSGASDVAGVIWINPIQGQSGIFEYGVFNLPRCDLAGASPICTPR
jgi:hypothetical protein